MYGFSSKMGCSRVIVCSSIGFLAAAENIQNQEFIEWLENKGYSSMMIDDAKKHASSYMINDAKDTDWRNATAEAFDTFKVERKQVQKLPLKEANGVNGVWQDMQHDIFNGDLQYGATRVQQQRMPFVLKTPKIEEQQSPKQPREAKKPHKSKKDNNKQAKISKQEQQQQQQQLPKQKGEKQTKIQKVKQWLQQQDISEEDDWKKIYETHCARLWDDLDTSITEDIYGRAWTELKTSEFKKHMKDFGADKNFEGAFDQMKTMIKTLKGGKKKLWTQLLIEQVKSKIKKKIGYGKYYYHDARDLCDKSKDLCDKSKFADLRSFLINELLKKAKKDVNRKRTSCECECGRLLGEVPGNESAKECLKIVASYKKKVTKPQKEELAKLRRQLRGRQCMSCCCKGLEYGVLYPIIVCLCVGIVCIIVMLLVECCKCLIKTEEGMSADEKQTAKNACELILKCFEE